MREKVTHEEASRMIRKDDEQETEMEPHLYGIDSSDPSLYDLVIHIKRLRTADAADIICEAVWRKCFEPDAESVKAMNDVR